MKPIYQTIGASLFALAIAVSPALADKSVGERSVVAEDLAFKADRADILAMAGNYRVRFEMQESTPWTTDYTPLEPKRSGGHEVVRVIEDTGRRIVLQSAYVSFSGETPIDPYLTVTATYQAPEHLVTVRVEGTARTPQLELSSDPPLDQSDVLALLLFGRTTSQLTGGQGTELRQEAIGILASYVAPELDQSLMDTFGLASLTFQLPTGTSYGSVGVGRYIGDDIFVSIGQTFGGPQGGTSRQLGGLVGSSVTVQYYLTPNVTLQTSSSTEGESALDAVWHTRY